ncbi:hypothetical protein [Caproicibacter sp.]|uniref:hypothetical protein n=1 Tax=Caproicibacter sp. TaxID=2814884 RepID=UPI003989265F
MVSEFMETGVQKVLSEKYPHLLLPAVLYAAVTAAQDANGYYVYALKILDKNGEVDNGFKEIPNVRSKVQVEKGTTVAVVLPYGELNPYILGVVV